MKLQEMKEMHFKKLAGDTFGYAQTWATWSVEGEATITIYLVEGDTVLIQFSAMNDSTGKEINKWLTRKVKDGRIQFNGVLYLVSYPENMVEEVVQTEEVPEVEGEVIAVYERGGEKVEVIHNPFAVKVYSASVPCVEGVKKVGRDTEQELHDLMFNLGYHLVEAPAVKEFTIYRKNDVHIVSAPQGEFALTIGGMFNVDYKDEHGEYFIENLLFMGSGPANDCLLFKNEREDILHMDPLKVQRVTIPFPKEHETVFGVFKEEPKEEVIEYRSFPYSLTYFSPFREIAVIDGNEFGYFVRKDEHGEMEYKVMAFHSQNSSNCSQVLAYESDCEGLERCINNFLSKGFQFGVWKMKPQKVRVKVIDNKKEREEKLLAAQSKVDRFERYRDILDKSLSRKGLTDEEREEMVLLYNELELSDSRNYYILAKAADTAIKGGAQ